MCLAAVMRQPPHLGKALQAGKARRDRRDRRSQPDGSLCAAYLVWGLSSNGTETRSSPNIRRVVTAISLMALGYPIGAAVGGMVAIPVIHVLGWRAVFLLGAAGGLILLPLVLLFVPESIQFLLSRRPGNALARMNAILARIDRPEYSALPERVVAQRKRATPFTALFLPPALRTTALAVVLNACVMATVYFIVSWTPKIISTLGFSDTIGVYGSLLMNLAGAVGCLVFGALAGCWGLRWLATITFVGLGLAVASFGVVSAEPAALITAALVAGFFLNAAIAALYATLPRLFPPDTRACGIGIALGGGRVGAVVGPYAAGLLMAAGWSRSSFCFVLAAPLVVATAALWKLTSGQGERQI